MFCISKLVFKWEIVIIKKKIDMKLKMCFVYIGYICMYCLVIRYIRWKIFDNKNFMEVINEINWDEWRFDKFVYVCKFWYWFW